MTRLLSYCTLILLCGICMAAEPLTSQSGHFEQEKHFAGFSKAFKSSGVFSLNKTQLKWQVITPVANTLLVKDGQVYLENAQGDLVAEPQAAPFVNLLHAVISNDLDALAKQFTISKQPQKGCLLLLPNEELISQLFANFELCLDKNNKVRHIRLNEHSANYTIIYFSDLTDTPMDAQ